MGGGWNSSAGTGAPADGMGRTGAGAVVPLWNTGEEGAKASPGAEEAAAAPWEWTELCGEPEGWSW